MIFIPLRKEYILSISLKKLILDENKQLIQIVRISITIDRK